MTLYRGEVVYDDSNYKSLIGDGQRVAAAGELRLLSAMPRPANADTSGYSRKFGASRKVYPRSDWSAMIKEREERKARCSDYCDFPAYDQDGIPYCWNFGPVQAMHNKRRMQGLPTPVALSPASVGGPVTGYRARGGWEGEALEYLAQHGATTVDKWPQASISRQYATAEVEADRANYKALEWDECETFDEFASALLDGDPSPVAYNWWRHVVYLCDLVEIEANSFGVRLRNSWHDNWGAKNELGFGGFAVGREGRYTPSSGFALREATSSVKGA